MTIFFLILALVFTGVSMLFGALNAFSNPIQTIFSVYGLVVWNALAGKYCPMVIN
jgi:hypothetical protein